MLFKGKLSDIEVQQQALENFNSKYSILTKGYKKKAIYWEVINLIFKVGIYASAILL